MCSLVHGLHQDGQRCKHSRSVEGPFLQENSKGSTGQFAMFRVHVLISGTIQWRIQVILSKWTEFKVLFRYIILFWKGMGQGGGFQYTFAFVKLINMQYQKTSVFLLLQNTVKYKSIRLDLVSTENKSKIVTQNAVYLMGLTKLIKNLLEILKFIFVIMACRLEQSYKQITNP